MRRLQFRLQFLLCCWLRLGRARQPGFSIHHDLLAYPQFEVVFSESYISEPDARTLVDKTDPSHPSYEAEFSSQQTDLASSFHDGSFAPNGEADADADHKVAETYEIMAMPPHRYLCAIPIIEPPPVLNETATELAKAEEARELARASAHGWDLMSGLDGACLYYVSGWWSYSFCYGHDVVQFHALPGSLKSGPPVRDPQTMEYVLGRVEDPRSAAATARSQRRGSGGSSGSGDGDGSGDGSGQSEDDENAQQQQQQGEQQQQHTGSDGAAVSPHPPNAELQVKGDQRYLVQRLGAGTVCDLTGRDRTIEVQYHCSPGSTQDRIGWIKEVTTCAYLMVVHTPRLCSDVAFQPPKETRANVISCRTIVSSEADEAAWHERKTLEAQAAMVGSPQASAAAAAAGVAKGPVIVGGIVVGGRQILGQAEDGKAPVKLAPPRGFFGNLKTGGGSGGGKTTKQQQQQQQQQQAGGAEERVVEVVAQGKGQDENSRVDVLTDEELEQMGISPELVEQLQQKLQELAGERGWKLEVVEVPGDPMEIRGVVEEDEDEEEGEGEGEGEGEDQGETAGSQEKFFREQL
ncbi:Protein OS-9 [Diatrype stigma]|uniref:Endoplasmic reticulum lectin n=1 Tax=Diatrype stigma TaxID=117547 RepID=A0AAN9UHN9_9PEZI